MIAASTLRIACIGRNGQTARALSACAPGLGVEIFPAGREALDLTRPETLAAFLDQARPDAVINAAAYNLVDRAESEPELAMAVNAAGPRALARWCRRAGVPFIHMSTDCVFDGAKTGPYGEDDPPNPLSAYGRSKRAGEIVVAEEDPYALIVRVCWVFSEYGDNFVSKMIELARSRPVLRVVSDQIGPPTYAPDIARALIAAARFKAGGRGLSGLLHVAAPGAMSRADMAGDIMRASAAMGGPVAKIEPVSTAEFAAAAPRPLNAQLGGARAAALFGLAFTPFEDALARSVRTVLERG